jgi:RNase H-fold protein (predicted Holliday junction resolvase)
MHDERFTTRIAEGMDHACSSEDSLAAALLLESWLQNKSRAD